VDSGAPLTRRRDLAAWNLVSPSGPYREAKNSKEGRSKDETRWTQKVEETRGKRE